MNPCSTARRSAVPPGLDSIFNLSPPMNRWAIFTVSLRDEFRPDLRPCADGVSIAHTFMCGNTG